MQYTLNNGIDHIQFTRDDIITAVDVIITTHFLTSAPLYCLLKDSAFRAALSAHYVRDIAVFTSKFIYYVRKKLSTGFIF